MDKCNCYYEIYGKTECWGTKEREECSCGGDETKCNFYPEKRAGAQAKKVMEDFKKNRKYTYEETNALRLVYVLDITEGLTELRVLADSVEQRNGWVLAIWRNQVVGGIREEYLKAFYLETDS